MQKAMSLPLEVSHQEMLTENKGILGPLSAGTGRTGITCTSNADNSQTSEYFVSLGPGKTNNHAESNVIATGGEPSRDVDREQGDFGPSECWNWENGHHLHLQCRQQPNQ